MYLTFHKKKKREIGGSKQECVFLFLEGCFCRRHRQRGRLLGLELSISLSLVFLKKKVALKIRV